jgi:hypothetical protein
VAEAETACAGVCGRVWVCASVRVWPCVLRAAHLSLSLSLIQAHARTHTHGRAHTTDGTNEWLFQRTPRPQRSEQEKKMREKKIKKGEIDPKEDCILKSTLSFDFV